MLKNIGLILIVILLLIILTFMLKLDVKKLVLNSVEKTLGYLGNINSLIHDKNMTEAKLNKDKTFVDSKLYKLLYNIILDLNIENATVEGLLCTILLGSLVIDLVLYYLLRSLVIFIIGLPVIAIFIITFLFMTSSDVYYERQYACMDAQTLITASLESGVYRAIVTNMDLFGPSVQNAYGNYVKRMKMKADPVDCLRLLGKELGEESTQFINELIQFQQDERSGQIEIFQDMDSDNSDRRSNMLEMQLFLQDLNRTYLLCLGITFIVGVLVVGSNMSLLEFFLNKPIGNILIAFDAVAVVFGFAKIQSYRG